MKYFVKVKPKARRNELTIINKDQITIETTAVPEKGKANISVIKQLAKYFKISQSKINIVSGLSSREKIIEIIK